MKAGVRQILGKTIKGVIVSDDNGAGPRTQVFLLFDDDTYYEFYGSQIVGSGGVDKGSELAAMRYAEKFGGRITRFDEQDGIMESAKPSQQQEPPSDPLCLRAEPRARNLDTGEEQPPIDWLQSLPPGGSPRLVDRSQGAHDQSQPQEPPPPSKHIYVKAQISGLDQNGQEVDLQTWLQSLPPGGTFSISKPGEQSQEPPLEELQPASKPLA